MFYRLKQFILLLGDIGMLYAGLFLGLVIRYFRVPGENFSKLSPALTPLFAFAIIILFIIGLYDVGRARNSKQFFQKILLTAVIWFTVSVFFFYARADLGVTPKTTLLLTTIVSFGALAVWRFFYNKFLSRNLLTTPIAFIGFNDQVREIIEVLHRFPEHGYNVFGLVADPSDAHSFPSGPSLRTLVDKNGGEFPGLIVLAEEFERDKNLLSELYGALYMQATVVPLADFYENFFKRIPPFTFSEAWFITHLKEQTRKIYDRFRIIMDIFFALLVGAVFVVTFPIVALLIKLTSKGPILFKQERVGRGGRKFTIYKYRTMKALTAEGSAEVKGPEFASVKDSRITPAGSFLRKTRIDELPQFINILKGEMAVIGPRPERPEFVRQLTEQMPFYALRHLVKPGLTGWAQLQKSYYGTIEENLVKLEYDLYYIKNRSLFLDVIILLKTVSVIVRFMGR